MKVRFVGILAILKIHKIVCIAVLTINLILYLFNEDCQQPMATSGFPQNTYMNTQFQSFSFSFSSSVHPL